MAFAGGEHQRGAPHAALLRAAVAVLQVDLRAALHQQSDHPLVAVDGGEHQRGAAVAALLVDLRTVLQQQLDHRQVAVQGGAQQQREAAHAVSLVRRVGPPAAVKPLQHRLLLASMSR